MSKRGVFCIVLLDPNLIKRNSLQLPAIFIFVCDPHRKKTRLECVSLRHLRHMNHRELDTGTHQLYTVHCTIYVLNCMRSKSKITFSRLHSVSEKENQPQKLLQLGSSLSQCDYATEVWNRFPLLFAFFIFPSSTLD